MLENNLPASKKPKYYQALCIDIVLYNKYRTKLFRETKNSTISKIFNILYQKKYLTVVNSFDSGWLLQTALYK